MARAVAVALKFPGTVHEAESCWYDTAGWPAWVEGLAEVMEVSGDWPAVGAEVVWQSGPAGRGRVSERVVAHELLAGQTVEVRDDSIRGRQSVSFSPASEEEVEITLRLEYELHKRSLFTPILDALFIRRAIAQSLRDTLSRFGAELEGTRQRRVG
jgi:uncharacterized membrane protein